jgi:DNA-binding MarR family transcriptional regulator
MDVKANCSVLGLAFVGAGSAGCSKFRRRCLRRSAARSTSVQHAALVAMGQNPEVDATPLSTLIAFDRSTTGDVFERLEGKGWIVRSPSPS